MAIPADHRPSVILGENGKVVPNIGSINIAQKKGKLRKVQPELDETVVSIQEHKDYFKNLRHVNLLLTNACNLSCSYCYEQHNRDFGKFTTESVNEVFHWFKGINGSAKKTLSFFGGEPLIHKKFILDWLEENREELGSIENRDFSISMTTNGLLLSKNFLKHWYSFDNTIMMVSLDTHLPALDHRGINQEQMDKLLDNIEYAAQLAGNPSRFAIRATVTREGAPYFRQFWEELYRRGVRHMVVHPLILSQDTGFVDWSEEEWEQLSNDLKAMVLEYNDVKNVRFAEGIGMKEETNCLTGSDTIAIDPSGDFSGCYFFTNRKQQIGKMLIGNVFDDSLYIDRYKDFHNSYKRMFETNDACKECDYKNTCYQCPAGNISTGEEMFRPDSMCWRLAKLHTEFQEAILQKYFIEHFQGLIQFVKTDGPIAYSYDLISLVFKYVTDYYLFTDEMKSQIPHDINHKKVVGYIYNLVKEGYYNNENRRKSITLSEVLDGIASSDEMDVKEAYVAIREITGAPSRFQSREMPPQFELATYISLLHLVVVDAAHPKSAAMHSAMGEK